MNKFGIMIIIVIFLTVTACSGFGNNSDKDGSKEKEAVSIIDEMGENSEVKGIHLYPAFQMEKDKKKWGFINDSGKFIVEPEYDFINEFNKNGVAVAAVETNEEEDYLFVQKYNYRINLVDRTGNIVAGPFYTTNIYSRNEEFLFFNTKESKSVVLDNGGNIVFESEYDVYDYANGMFCFKQNSMSDTLYGYMNDKGEVVIPAIYKHCYPFVGDKACVQLDYRKHAIIDKEGKVLEEIDQYIALRETKDGMKPFLNETREKWGVKNEAGEIVISPQFKSVSGFQEGFAVVKCQVAEYENYFGLIDKKGNFIMSPEYIEITYLGANRFSAYKGEFYHSYFGYLLPKAIFDEQGKQLTPFKYFNLEKFDGDYASCSDGKSTFFIDREGNIAGNLPKFEGAGILKKVNNLIRGSVDSTIYYYFSNDGKVIWQGDETIKLDDGLEVKTVRFQPDYYTDISYPQFSGFSSKSVQDSINNKLKEEFIGNYTDDNGTDKPVEEFYDASTIDKSFTAEKNRDLLLVSLDAYFYPIGAAHGSPYSEKYHIDLETGRFYRLKDLFKKDVLYTDRLTSAVRELVPKDYAINESISSEVQPNITDDSHFFISKDCLTLYFHPGDINAYAGGFVYFNIPYGKIIDLIDVDGEFWKSFDKEIKQNVTQYIDVSNEKIIASVEEVLGVYEQSIIDAINANDFQKVEAVLEKDSKLYNDQKELVARLRSQGIKERLESFDIYAIKYELYTDEYKIYVTENISIKRPQRDFETEQFDWCYTAKYDREVGITRLIDIEKW